MGCAECGQRLRVGPAQRLQLPTREGLFVAVVEASLLLPHECEPLPEDVFVISVCETWSAQPRKRLATPSHVQVKKSSARYSLCVHLELISVHPYLA